MDVRELLQLALDFAGSLERVIIIGMDKQGRAQYAVSSDDEAQTREDVEEFLRAQGEGD
jgi:hypothetical protein